MTQAIPSTGTPVTIPAAVTGPKERLTALLQGAALPKTISIEDGIKATTKILEGSRDFKRYNLLPGMSRVDHFVTNGRWLCASGDCTLALYNQGKMECSTISRRGDPEISSLFLVDEKLYIGDKMGRVNVFNIPSLTHYELSRVASEITALYVEGNHLFIGHSDGYIKVVDLERNILLNAIGGTFQTKSKNWPDDVQGITSLLKIGDKLCSASKHGIIDIFDCKNNFKRLHSIETDRCEFIYLRNDNGRLLGVQRNVNLRWWDLNTYEPVHEGYGTVNFPYILFKTSNVFYAAVHSGIQKLTPTAPYYTQVIETQIGSDVSFFNGKIYSLKDDAIQVLDFTV